MKRNWDCIRSVLLAIESRASPDSRVRSTDLPGWSAVEVSYHIRLMVEAGLIEAHDVGSGPASWVADEMTWAGHQLLDRIRGAATWKALSDVSQHMELPLTLESIETIHAKYVDDMMKRVSL